MPALERVPVPMEIKNLHDLPPPNRTDLVCRRSVSANLLFFVVCGLISAGLFWFAREGGYETESVSLPPFLLYWISGVSALLALAGYRYFRASLRSSNWLLRVGFDRVTVKFRSHLNDHFSAGDPVVVSIPFAEIEWARRYREALNVPSSDLAGRTEALNFLDLKLHSDRVEMLRTALSEERTRQAPREGIVQIKHMDFPVRLVGDDILRVRWSGIRPGFRKTLRFLGRRIPVVAEARSEVSDWRKLEGRQLEYRILDLVDRGKTIGAIALVRQRYGCTTAEAKRFIEELKVGPLESTRPPSRSAD